MSNSVLQTVARSRITSIVKKSFALASVGGIAGLAYQYREIKNLDQSSVGHANKKVLVLPFHRMKIVESKRNNNIDYFLNTLKFSSSDKDERPMELELRELVNIIHSAADDPNISNLYGSFGQGFGFKCGGFAHIEEIRNAIKIFNQSRVHDLFKENDDDHYESSHGKHSFAFADTFENPMDSCNREYFLASSFSQVHIQSRGNMNIFGVSLSNVFLRGALDKYGIKAYIFKHGKYKNAPNSLSEKKYTKSHFENTKDIVQSINQTICSSITSSRYLSNKFDGSIWNSLHDFGTMTAENAKEIGLVDYLPNIDPLSDFLAAKNDKEASKQLQMKWGKSLNLDSFHAKESISLEEYRSALVRRKKAKKMKWLLHKVLRGVAGKNSVFEIILSTFGYESPYFNMDENEYDKDKSIQTNEKIALLHITGTIDDSVAKKVGNALRKIKKNSNVKCVILRIDSPGGSSTSSEFIRAECKDIPQPIICSFANYAASGGYYVATASNRIFALPTTLTGSIGVFGIKFDATGLGRRHGIEVEHVTSGGKHSLTYNAFAPLTNAVRKNLLRNMDRIYSYFKEIVAENRNMTLKEVEAIAQGRIWTGTQGRQVGLVDELGGIDCAIAFAMKKYTTTGFADVEVWPQQPSIKDKIKEVMTFTDGSKETATSDFIKFVLSGNFEYFSPLNLAPVTMLTMDEDSAIHLSLASSIQDYPGSLRFRQQQ